MKELTFDTMLAVFEEMFGGPLFWALVVVALLVTIAYLFVLMRDRAVSWKKFLLAQLSMPVGSVVAVTFLMAITNSSLSDMGGPIDIVVLLGVAALGAVGMAILVYAAQSLVKPPR